MKKTLLLGLTLLGGLSVNAQALNNVPAPDFTATDINGTVHTLSEYLDAGKTVVLDVSAAWCGPCWSFHESHALNDLYNSYGPAGTNEVVVLFVEGDAGTPLENIYGTGTSPRGNPQGNWTLGTDYPIIDSAAIADAYGIEAFPTVFMICPDNGKVYEIDRGDLDVLVDQLNTVCGTEPVGLPNYARIMADSRYLCDSSEAIPVTVSNMGTPITSATIELSKNGEVIATETFELNIPEGQRERVYFEGLNPSTLEDYEATLTQVNGVAPHAQPGHPEYVVTEGFQVGVNTNSVTSYNNVRVIATLDYYPTDVIWAFIDSKGDAVHVQQYSANKRLTTQVTNVNLPEGIECYTFYVGDQYADGMNYTGAQTQGSYDDYGFEVLSAAGTAEETLLFEHNGDYPQIVEEALFRTNGILGNEEFAANNTFAVYPNPTSGILNFTTQETVNVTVVDLQGKTVFSASNINNGDSINLSTLQTGMYIAKINGETSERIEKIMIK